MNESPATDVFGVMQYSETTLKGIHRDLLRNPLSRRPGTWEKTRLGIIAREMRRRGFRVKRKVETSPSVGATEMKS